MTDKLMRPFYLSKMRYGDTRKFFVSSKYQAKFVAEVYDEIDAQMIVDSLNAFGEELGKDEGIDD
jgi:hypothetical protein